jgi:hypothetical protein
MKSREERQRWVSLTLSITKGTSLAPDPYEWELLQEFIEGSLLLDEVLDLIEARRKGRIGAILDG